MKAVTIRELSNEDWKTQLAQGYPNIPADAVVEVIDNDFNNWYGNWCIVMYNNIRYYVSEKDLIFNKEIVKKAIRMSEKNKKK